jgi:glycosyltransferase involved in cell wall biosynthesis
LNRLIPSVLNQSLKPIEIIVIDDGSIDDLAESIINSYLGLTDIPIIFKKKINGGPSSARNVGLKLAKGEFILFIDADDELIADSIEWRQKIIESLSEEFASIYCSSINSYENKPELTEKVMEVRGQIDSSLIGRKNGVPGGSPYHFFRRKALIDVNGYSESLKFNEDFELILRIAKKWMLFGVNRVGFIRHIRKDSWSKLDPYISYNGVESFLKVAANQKLLHIIEINKRKKENKLSLVKSLLLQRKKWKEIRPYLYNAFNTARPENAKELMLFVLSKII